MVDQGIRETGRGVGEEKNDESLLLLF